MFGKPTPSANKYDFPKHSKAKVFLFLISPISKGKKQKRKEKKKNTLSYNFNFNQIKVACFSHKPASFTLKFILQPVCRYNL